MSTITHKNTGANTRKRNLTYDIVIVGVMAAVIFVTTSVVKIGPIPTPAGNTMIKLANAFCLMAGILFGGVRGGLAAGIGSMIYDLTDPAFVSGAPFTLVFFFMMAFVAGAVSHIGKADGKNTVLNIIGAISGAVTYLVLYLGKSVIVLVLAGSDLSAAMTACATKFITSGINAVIAVVVAVPLSIVCRKALERAGFTNKLF